MTFFPNRPEFLIIQAVYFDEDISKNDFFTCGGRQN